MCSARTNVVCLLIALANAGVSSASRTDAASPVAMASPQCPPGAPGVRGQDDPLALGETVKVRVNVMGTRFFSWLSLELHGDGKSSSISIWRMSPEDRTIRWSAAINGDTPVSEANSTLAADDGDGEYPEDQDFPGGEHTFVVARRPAVPGTPEHMAVWLQERPDRVARVAVQPGADRLRVSTFIGSICPKFYTDADAVGCSYQGMALAVGQRVRVGVFVLRTDVGPTFVVERRGGAADDVALSSVVVLGVAEDRRSWTYEAYGPDGSVVASHTDLPGFEPEDSFGQPQMAPQAPDGEFVFVVERRPAEAAVWLEANPDFVARTPVRDGDGQAWLRVSGGQKQVLYETA